MSDRSELLTAGYDPEQVALLKRTIAKDATDDELALFLMRCKRTGLDPFAGQIYFNKRKSRSGDRVTIQTGIDGFRAIADDTGKLAGIDEPEFLGEGLWNDGKTFPLACRLTVWKLVEGQRVPFTAVCRWEEYYPGDNDAGNWMWRKMPYNQLAKCAEAAALRRGFPQKLGGLYAPEELEQAREETSSALVPARTINRGASPHQQQRPKPAERPALPPPPPEVKAFNELLRAAGKKWPEVVAVLSPRYPDLTPATKFKDIPAGALAEAEMWLRAHVPPGPDEAPTGKVPADQSADPAAIERLGREVLGGADEWEVWLADRQLSPAGLDAATPEVRRAVRGELERLKAERDKPPGE